MGWDGRHELTGQEREEQGLCPALLGTALGTRDANGSKTGMGPARQTSRPSRRGTEHQTVSVPTPILGCWGALGF